MGDVMAFVGLSSARSVSKQRPTVQTVAVWLYCTLGVLVRVPGALEGMRSLPILRTKPVAMEESGCIRETRWAWSKRYFLYYTHSIVFHHMKSPIRRAPLRSSAREAKAKPVENNCRIAVPR